MNAEPSPALGAPAGRRRSRLAAGWQWVDRAGGACEALAGVALLAVMLLTGADIIGRAFGRPIPGTYELVSFTGGLIFGLAMPATARAHGHVFVDLVTSHLGPVAARRLQLATRLAGVAVLLLVGWGIAEVGADLRASGEVSPVLGLPFYPVAYGIAAALALSCLGMLAWFFAPRSAPP